MVYWYLKWVGTWGKIKNVHLKENGESLLCTPPIFYNDVTHMYSNYITYGDIKTSDLKECRMDGATRNVRGHASLNHW